MEVWQLACVVCAVVGAAAYVGIDLKAIRRSAELIDYHRDYVVSGRACPVRVKEQATSVYAAYHDLGGNGTGTKLYQEIMNAHVEED